jgi:protein-S-isoprenylcysteine O-methyltransferase Ste14
MLSLVLWGIIHSLLASLFIKDLVRGLVGPTLFRLYRLGYNVFAAASFLPVLYLMRSLPDQWVYSVPPPWSYFFIGGQFLSALLLLLALTQTDVLSFIGLSQIYKNQESSALVTKGLYRYVRHPLYTFSLLFLWLTPTLTQNSIVVFLGATIYVLIGTWFEERKLIKNFGQAYAEYQLITPMLIPYPKFRRNL